MSSFLNYKRFKRYTAVYFLSLNARDENMKSTRTPWWQDDYERIERLLSEAEEQEDYRLTEIAQQQAYELGFEMYRKSNLLLGAVKRLHRKQLESDVSYRGSERESLTKKFIRNLTK